MTKIAAGPPRWAKWLIPLVSCLALGYLMWSLRASTLDFTTLFGEPDRVTAWALLALGPLSPLYVTRRVEVDLGAGVLTHSLRGHTLARFRLCEVSGITRGLLRVTLRFEREGRVALWAFWPGASAVVACVRKAWEERERDPGREVSRIQPLVPSSEVDLPYRYLRFPARCVVCDEAAVYNRYVSASRGFDVLAFWFWSSIDIPVPTCQRHYKRRVAGTWVLTALVLGAIVCLIRYRLLERMLPSKLAEWLGVGVLLAAYLFMANLSGQILDWFLLGVQPRSVDKERGVVTLRVRRVDLREELLFRTDAERRRSEALELAQEALRETPPPSYGGGSAPSP